MERIFDYIIIFLCCCVVLLSRGLPAGIIIPICISIILGCLFLIFNNFVIHLILYVIFILLTFLLPDLTFFIPLMSYSFFRYSYIYIIALSAIPIYSNMSHLHILMICAIFFISLLSFLLKHRTDQYLEERKTSERIRNELILYNSNLNSKNKELLEKQDYEVTNAILNERNRIAREIHDLVGHVLSSSILQIAALTTIEKEESVKQTLKQINETLTNGMNSIRSSIHNIHDSSIDLNMKLTEIINGFQFCKIDYLYDIDNDFTMKAKYNIMFIVKEALTNIAKHSNATLVELHITQTPAFYKIDIHDNGSNISKNTTSSGIGIISIYDRISSLEGSVNITKNNGYRIYITFPVTKEKASDS